ncbi:MAG: glycosyltransferase, partial [Candidatus Neomarinimicrobiota bacterium]
HFHSEAHERAYLDLKPDFTARKVAHGRLDLDSTFAPHRQRFPDLESFYQFMAYVVFRETRRYRVGRLTSLLAQPLAVFGIDDWKNYLPAEVVHKPVAYFKETPSVYRSSAVTLSLATFQQETALNQRLFDVPLCNGFVLSDWQDSLAEHFEPEEEIITFRSDEELKDKVHYFLGHPSAREQVSRKARERVLAEHLMEHRVANMLERVTEVLA